jgi:pimeloyl-ACP methyl ester carboxylesterase
VLNLMGIRLIAYDRPGYGGSTRQCGRQVKDAAADVEAIADELGIERFAVIGRSGGAPHALACAALLGKRVTAAAALVSLAPRGAPGLDWADGMSNGNRRETQQAVLAAKNADAMAELKRRVAESTEALARSGFPPDLHAANGVIPPADRRVLADSSIRTMLMENNRHSIEDDANLERVDVSGTKRALLVGWLDDIIAFSGNWGFDVSSIDVPVLLWHGERDVFSPVAHSRWLHGNIKDSTLVIEPHEAHLGAIEVLPFALEWLRSRSGQRCGPRAAARSDTAPDRDCVETMLES